MKSDSEVWSQLDKLFDEKNHPEWRHHIQQMLSPQVDLENLSRSCKTLFSLHSMNLDKGGKNKALGYGMLATYCYIHLGRMAPAIAMLDSLKPIKAPSSLIESLEKDLSTHFSKEKSKTKASSAQPQKTSAEHTEIKSTIEREFKLAPSDGPPIEDFSLFSGLSYSEIHGLIKQSKVVELKENEILFKEGDDSESFYIVAEGKVELQCHNGTRQTFEEGDFFGELAALGNLNRTGEIRAKSNCKLIEFEKDKLISNFVAFPQMEEKILSFFHLRLFLFMTSKLKAFKAYSRERLEEFFYTMEPKQLAAHQVLCKKDEPSEEFYFLLSGQMELQREDGQNISIYPSTFIGEIGFIDRKPRSDTVITKTTCHFLVCPRYMFENFQARFPDIVDIMKKVSSYRQAQNQKTLHSAV